MSASTRTVQVTLGMRHVAAATLAVAVAIGLAAVLAFGPSTASGPQTAPAVPAGPLVSEQGPGSGLVTEPGPGEFRLGPGNLEAPGVVVPLTPKDVGSAACGSDTGGSNLSGGSNGTRFPQ
jgi:hypothetical protein